MDFRNPLFADGRIHLALEGASDDVLVFLPGYYVGVQQVLFEREHPQYMRQFSCDLGVGIASWDWPLQGDRGASCLYLGLRSVVSAEREYARILPALGTCLWREFVEELAFALRCVKALVGQSTALHVVGWSMGGQFAYVAPLLGTPVASTTAIGSCARVRDLIREGKTRRHGFFFYPLHGLAFFDLEDLVRETMARGTPVAIIHGDEDPGCLASTRHAIQKSAPTDDASGFSMDVVPGHGHVFSRELQDRLRKRLEAILGVKR